MKTITVSYPQIPNMGDILNEVLIEKLFGYRVVSAKAIFARLSAIGSGLGGYLYTGSTLHRVGQFVFGRIYPSPYIWGTGFISYKDHDDSFARKVKVCATRGELTRQRVEKILGHELDIPTGDGGLLSSYLLTDQLKKTYDVGIVAHYKEQDHPFFRKLLDFYPNSTFVDTRKDPMTVIRHIAQCKYILSSSLHGLIMADSFNIPNVHIKVTDKLSGDGYKFDDYYSGYGIKHQQFREEDFAYPPLEWIDDNYQITKAMVDAKKRGLIDSFPFSHNMKCCDVAL